VLGICNDNVGETTREIWGDALALRTTNSHLTGGVQIHCSTAWCYSHFSYSSGRAGRQWSQAGVLRLMSTRLGVRNRGRVFCKHAVSGSSLYPNTSSYPDNGVEASSNSHKRPAASADSRSRAGPAITVAVRTRPLESPSTRTVTIPWTPARMARSGYSGATATRKRGISCAKAAVLQRTTVAAIAIPTCFCRITPPLPQLVRRDRLRRPRHSSHRGPRQLHLVVGPRPTMCVSSVHCRS
jgi:hypothetical protein